MTSQSVRIVAHSMSRPDWESISGIGHYEQRAGVVVREQDWLVVSTDVEPGYLDYRRDLLGLRSRALQTKAPGANLAQRIINDDTVLGKLREVVASGALLDTFIVGPDEERLAESLGVNLLGSASSSHYFGSKTGFRAVAQKTGVSVAPGIEGLQNLSELLLACDQLFDTGSERIVVKGDQGASSTENLVLSKNDLDWKNKVQSLFQSFHVKSCVVESWIDDVTVSPSIHFIILDSGVVPLMGPWQQVLVGENREYAGIMHPPKLTLDVQEKLRMQGFYLASKYFAEGYRGYVGYDAIVRENSDIVWVECNARKGGPYYPMRFAENMGLEGQVVWGMDLCHEQIRTMRFSQLLEAFGDILFDEQIRDQGGVVLYNPGLMEIGKIQTIIIASDDQRAQYLWRRLRAV
jgi:hypothetical protein